MATNSSVDDVRTRFAELISWVGARTAAAGVRARAIGGRAPLRPAVILLEAAVARPAGASRVAKPWGSEELLTCDQYAAKFLHVRAGHRLSLQYHLAKTETLIVHRGIAQIQVGDEQQVYRPGDCVHIPAGVRHRISATAGEDVDLIELSTPELDDVVRLADDYGRNRREDVVADAAAGRQP